MEEKATAEATQEANKSEEARKILEQEFMAKKQKCWEEVMAVMQKFQMRFDVSTVIRSDGKVSHHLDIVQ
jgi:hypothetical protein